MYVRIITVGTKSRPAISSVVDTYVNRLPRELHLEWMYVKHGTGDTRNSMEQEAEKILKLINRDNLVVLLDETGVQLTSERVSERFLSGTRDVVFIIGGAYGVSDSVKERSDFVWSLSKLVFPHQIVRIIISEQLYRASTIQRGHPYHHT